MGVGEETVEFLGRGEVARYREGGRTLEVETLAGRGVIFARSIRRWEDGARVTADERARVIAAVSRVMLSLGAERVEVVER